MSQRQLRRHAGWSAGSSSTRGAAAGEAAAGQARPLLQWRRWLARCTIRALQPPPLCRQLQLVQQGSTAATRLPGTGGKLPSWATQRASGSWAGRTTRCTPVFGWFAESPCKPLCLAGKNAHVGTHWPHLVVRFFAAKLSICVPAPLPHSGLDGPGGGWRGGAALAQPCSSPAGRSGWRQRRRW